MLSMANLSSSDSLQQPWSNAQSKNHSQSKSNSHGGPGGKKAGGGGGSNGKRPTKRLPKKPRKSSSVESLDYDDEQDHMDACFKDSDYGEEFVEVIFRNEKIIRSHAWFHAGAVNPRAPTWNLLF